MGIGYDSYVDTRNFDQEGITGEVSRFTVEEMLYPNIILIQDKDYPIQEHKIKVLASMFACEVTQVDEESAGAIFVYYGEAGKLVHIGRVFPRQVKPLLRLFEENKKQGYLSKDKELYGDYLYVLSE